MDELLNAEIRIICKTRITVKPKQDIVRVKR